MIIFDASCKTKLRKTHPKRNNFEDTYLVTKVELVNNII